MDINDLIPALKETFLKGFQAGEAHVLEYNDPEAQYHIEPTAGS